MPRLRPLRDPVTIHLDGAAIPAERGEPVAVALVGAGHVALARSPKFHRPRGPACLRAACDGCLARVDGVPNVMTCRVPALDGMWIETQNVVGSRETDLLRAADWFFPDGMNHHELLAGVPALQSVMQSLARRVAGLGRLPEEAAAPRPARRRSADALVVGSGPAGMAVALELGAGGRSVEVVDDDLTWGGSVRALLGAARPWDPLVRRFERALSERRVMLRLQTMAAGVYGDDVLVAGEEGVEVVTARTLVLATGVHDGAWTFQGNDLPGVLSARAACRLLDAGVAIGRRVVVAVIDEAGVYGAAFAAAHPGTEVVAGAPVAATGTGRVRAVTFATPAGERRIRCDALVCDGVGAPAYELCAQAGATLTHEARGFVVRTGPAGQIAAGVFAVGGVVGTPSHPDAVARAARVVADAARQ